MLEILSSNLCFGGKQLFCKHDSKATQTAMTFSIYLPLQAQEKSCPVLYWLSGLTCTAENFTIKAGFQKIAAELGIIVVAPDTSPRGAGIEGEDESYDLGTGAGFYVDATEEKWSQHYNMYSYVTDELPKIVNDKFPTIADHVSISGHSMGGHGALICALKNPGLYRSVSAFAPIVAPSQCPWGEKAFSAYLGEDREIWKKWDAVELIKAGAHVPTILVEQGTADDFLEGQLKPELLSEACCGAGIDLTLNERENYDHSYYFISSFIEDHLRWHAERLKG
jgi:S-formylglutathione hydrolase